jgi:3-oxoacyl-[acyl-carrier protein] reductase
MMVISQVRIVQTPIPAMIENKWGRIFLVGASAVSQPIPGNVLSNMYRTGMAQYCKTLAGDVIKDGVTVNVVSPMTVLTDRTRSTAANVAGKKGISPEEELANREAALPSGRFGAPEEYGALVAYLSGQYAGYCTGSNWRVDGGNVKAL